MSSYTILTFPSNTTWDLLHPDAKRVRVEDIGWGLACGAVRFNGHMRGPYNVAQHSVLVHELVNGTADWPLEFDGPAKKPVWLEDKGRWAAADSDAEFRAGCIHALFHDAHEAYLGDMVGPLKDLLRSLGRPFGLKSPWDWLEERHDEAIFSALGLDGYDRHGPMYSVIRAADKAALRIERKAIGTYAHLDWVRKLPTGTLMDPVSACNLFLARAVAYDLPVGVKLPFEDPMLWTEINGGGRE